MNKVYQIHTGCKYEGGGTVSIHRTLEGARKKVQEIIEESLSHNIDDDLTKYINDWRESPTDHWVRYSMYSFNDDDAQWQGDLELHETSDYIQILETEVNE